MQNSLPGRWPVLEFSTIEWANLRPIRQVVRHYGNQDHSRWVFKGKLPVVGPSIVKLWNPFYVRAATFAAALDSGFFDAEIVPGLAAILVSDGGVRGYVMQCGTRRHGDVRDFDRLVRARTAKTGYFAVQYSPAHTLMFDGRPGLIDLEGVYPLADAHLVAAHHSAFADAAYRDFVAGLLDARGIAVGDLPMEDNPDWRTAPLRRLAFIGRQAVARLRAPGEFDPDLIKNRTG